MNPNQQTPKNQTVRRDAKNQPDSKFSIDKKNQPNVLILLAIFLAIVGYWYYKDLKDEVKVIDEQIDTLKAEEQSIQPYMSEAKQDEVTSKLPLYNDITKDFLQKKDAETAIELRDLASSNSLSISNYETILDDVSYVSDVESGSSQLIVPYSRQANFILSGTYPNMLNFLKEVEQLDRYIVVSEISFSGNQVESSSSYGYNQNYFNKFSNINTALTEVTYFFLSSSIESS